MAYKVLYREWRPQKFQEIVGQDHITITMQNAICNGRVAHAYLFCGPRGTGKTTTAKVLAKSLNCMNLQGVEPCGICDNCVEIQGGTSMDVIEIDAASNRGIDEVREIRENIKFSPATGRKRVYIIDEVHMLTDPAFNALLKTLEEPPEHMVFILATTEPHKVPLTILSRCQRFDFHRISDHVMSQRLQEVAKVTGIHLAENALGQIIKVAEGGLRDALSMLDQVASYGNGQVTLENVHRMLGTVNQDILENFTEYILAGEAGKCLVLLGEVYQQGQEIKLLAGALASHLREHMLRMVASPAEKNTLALDRLLTILNLITTVEQEMKWSTQPRVLLEVALVRCCRFSQYETMVPTEQYRDLLLRIEQLENQLLDLSQDISFSNKPVADSNGERKISVSEDTFFEKQQDIEPKEVNKEVKKTIVKQPRQEKQEVVQSNLEHPAELTTGQRVKHIKEPLQYEGNSLANLGEHKDNKSLGKGKELDNSLLTKIMARWKDVLECINGAKTYHNIYSYLSKGTGAWPLGVKDGILTVGFWKKDSNALLASSMMELEDNKEPFQKILQSVCQESLHVRFVLTEDEPPQHSEVQASSLDIDDAANLFQGEEQEIPEDNPFD